MEKVSSPIAVFFSALMLMVSSALAQQQEMNAGEIDDIATLSMPEAEKRLNYLIAETDDTIQTVEQAIKMVQNMKFEVSPGKPGVDYRTESPIRYEKPFTPLTTQQLVNRLNSQKTQTTSFKQAITSTGSEIRFSNKPLEKLFADAWPKDNEPDLQYKITQVSFWDGSEQKLQPVIISEADDGYYYLSASSTFTLPTSKPIKGIEFEIRYPSYSSFKKVVLNKEQPKMTTDDGSSYQLISIKGGKVSLQLALPEASHYLVEGLTASGQVLPRTGSSFASMPSDEQLQQFKQYRDDLVKTRRDINQFTDSKALQAHLEKLTDERKKALEKNNKKHIQQEVKFVAQPESVVIYLLAMQEKSNTFNQTLTNELAEQDRYIAKDDASNTFGLVDKSGNWVIKPQFHKIEQTDISGIYLMTDEGSSHKDKDTDVVTTELIYTYMSFDPQTRQLKKLPFKDINKHVGDN